MFIHPRFSMEELGQSPAALADLWIKQGKAGGASKEVLTKMFEKIAEARGKGTFPSEAITFEVGKKTYFVVLDGKEELILLEKIRELGRGRFGEALEVEDKFRDNDRFCLKRDFGDEDEKELYENSTLIDEYLDLAAMQKGLGILPIEDRYDTTFVEKMGLPTTLFDGSLQVILEKMDFSLPEKLDLVVQVLMGLKGFLEKGWAHSDMHDQNILINLSPLVAVIADFGKIDKGGKSDGAYFSMMFALWGSVLKPLVLKKCPLDKATGVDKLFAQLLSGQLCKKRPKPQEIDALIAALEKAFPFPKEYSPSYKTMQAATAIQKFIQSLTQPQSAVPRAKL